MEDAQGCAGRWRAVEAYELDRLSDDLFCAILREEEQSLNKQYEQQYVAAMEAILMKEEESQHDERVEEEKKRALQLERELQLQKEKKNALKKEKKALKKEQSLAQQEQSLKEHTECEECCSTCDGSSTSHSDKEEAAPPSGVSGSIMEEKEGSKLGLHAKNKKMHPHNCEPCRFFCFSFDVTCNKGDDCDYCHMSHTSKRMEKKIASRKNRAKNTKGLNYV